MPGLITERNFPTSWTIKRFKYCAQICNGGEYSDIEVEEGGYPVIGSGGEFARASKFSYFLSYLVKEIEVGSGGNDFDIADKITVSNFRQKKTGENTHEIESKPEVSLPTPNEVFMDEAVKKKLSEIIDEINAAYNKNFDVDVASKSALQMRDILLKNGHLRDSARNNSLKDFRFAYFDAVQDALIAGYEQNQDFFALLLDNDEKKRELMQVFLEDVYRNLRT